MLCIGGLGGVVQERTDRQGQERIVTPSVGIITSANAGNICRIVPCRRNSGPARSASASPTPSPMPSEIPRPIRAPTTCPETPSA